MKLTIHNTFPDTTFVPVWNDLVAESITNAPFLRYEYLAGWWQGLGGGEWKNASPFIVTAVEDDRLIGVAPLFQATNREGQSALMLLGSIEISDYLDLIVREADVSRFTSALFDELAAQPPDAWTMLDWYNLPDTSPTLAALKAEADRRGWVYAEEIYKPTPSIPLPGDWETYLSGIDKKQRHEIRRKMRRAEESGRAVRWYIVDDENQLDGEIEGFLALMAGDPEKASFLSEPMRAQMCATAHAAFRAGYLQLAFIEVDGEKAAGYFNFDYGNKIWVYNSGLDRKFMELSPGWVLLGYLLQWANEHKRAEFDFMRGEEDYKYKFGGQNRHVMRVKVIR
jgi:CelD/BcsL family acetyltransferase involved in cellulose biosynthesis